MNKCKCGSTRLAEIFVDGKDCAGFNYIAVDGTRLSYDGYVPFDRLDLGYGGELQAHLCLDCGRLQSDKFPISDDEVKRALYDEEDEEVEYEGPLPTDYIPNQYTNEGLYTFTVILEDRNVFSEVEYFICEAEDSPHAKEQALNANPDYDILWVNRGINPNIGEYNSER